MPEYPHRMFIKWPWYDTPWEIPVPPEEITAQMGQIVRTFEVVALGETIQQGGSRLETAAWQSFFPIRYDPNVVVSPPPTERLFRTPDEWIRSFRYAMRNRRIINLSIDNTQIDMKCAVPEFKYGYMPGDTGDVWYQISLVEARFGTIRQFDGDQFPTTGLRGNPGLAGTPRTYKVNPGDTIADVSQKMYGTPEHWIDIYKENIEELSLILFTPTPEIPANDPFAVDPSWGPIPAPTWNASDPLPTGILLRIPILE